MRTSSVAWVILAVLVVGPVCGCRPREGSTKSTAAAISHGKDESTPAVSPHATISAFINAVSDSDLRTAARLVKGGQPDTDFSRSAARIKRNRPWAELTDISYGEPGDRMTVRTTVLSCAYSGAPRRTDTFDMVLVRESGRWLIVPPERLAGGEPLILAYAHAVSHPEMLERSEASAAAADCLVNAKRIATALLMASSKTDGILKVDAESWAKSVAGRGVNLHCPCQTGDAISYSLNTSLIGKNLEALRDPTRLVLLYEGKAGKLDFRHNGKATVAFANGGVKQIDAEAAKALSWEP